MREIRFGSKQNHLLLGNSLLRCYILENMERVFTINSIQKALGYDGKSENWLTEFLTTINKFIPIYTELITRFNNFSLAINLFETQKLPIKTIESKFLLEACIAILKAKNEGFLNVSQLKYSKAATAILENIGNSNINDLIDEATGFNLFKKNSVTQIIQYLQNQVQDSAYEWLSTVPDEFIESLMLMNESNWTDINKNRSILAKIINDIIYSRIDNNLLEEMRVLKPKRDYKRKNNLKQDTEHPKLKEYITAIQSLIKASVNNWNIFIQLINKAYPKQKNRTVINYPENKENLYESESNFNEKLKMVLLKK